MQYLRYLLGLDQKKVFITAFTSLLGMHERNLSEKGDMTGVIIPCTRKYHRQKIPLLKRYTSSIDMKQENNNDHQMHRFTIVILLTN